MLLVTRHRQAAPPQERQEGLGFALGLTLGFALGLTLGFALGLTLGFALGLTLGFALGLTLGFALGSPPIVGPAVRFA
ncbi:MAG: hypothetical protein E6J90_36590, partial [Deltaproteobacteria bacterium]